MLYGFVSINMSMIPKISCTYTIKNNLVDSDVLLKESLVIDNVMGMSEAIVRKLKLHPYDVKSLLENITRVQRKLIGDKVFAHTDLKILTASIHTSLYLALKPRISPEYFKNPHFKGSIYVENDSAELN